jgi:hypothetical protein
VVEDFIERAIPPPPHRQPSNYLHEEGKRRQKDFRSSTYVHSLDIKLHRRNYVFVKGKAEIEMHCNIASGLFIIKFSPRNWRGQKMSIDIEHMLEMIHIFIDRRI